jgi:hypothetical protein
MLYRYRYTEVGDSAIFRLRYRGQQINGLNVVN